MKKNLQRALVTRLHLWPAVLIALACFQSSAIAQNKNSIQPVGPTAATTWASGPQTTVLYRFKGSPDGRSPNGQLIADQIGNLYGTTTFGGISDNGIVFELSPPGHQGGQWNETVLYKFKGGSDGIAPVAGLVFDQAGNLYGATVDGGQCHFGCGTIFRLSPPRRRGGSWSKTVLHAFGGPNSSDGGTPTGSLVFDNQGNLYGTTELGGNVTCPHQLGPCGVVFRLSLSKDGAWTETVLYNFTGVPDGQFPFGYLVIDDNGNLFGGTTEGGTGKCTDGERLIIGCGTTFKLSPTNGDSWSETVLYDFQTSDSGPAVDLLLDSTGNLYGTGGYNVIKLAPPQSHGDTWTEHFLHLFPGGLTGRLPSSSVVADHLGNLYGTTWANALESRFGTVYELSPPTGHGKQWTLTTLHRFPGNFESEQPKGLLLRNKSGELYGATSALSDGNGYIFRIVP